LQEDGHYLLLCRGAAKRVALRLATTEGLLGRPQQTKKKKNPPTNPTPNRTTHKTKTTTQKHIIPPTKKRQKNQHPITQNSLCTKLVGGGPTGEIRSPPNCRTFHRGRQSVKYSAIRFNKEGNNQSAAGLVCNEGGRPAARGWGLVDGGPGQDSGLKDRADRH